MFGYRYLPPSSKVFIIVDYRPRSLNTPFFNHKIYSEPYYSRERKDQRNALVGFADRDMCDTTARHVSRRDLVHLEVQPVDLWELKSHSQVLSMPLIVYVTPSELYYYNGLEKDKRWV